MDPLTQVFVEDMQEDISDDLFDMHNSYGDLIDQLSGIDDNDIDDDKDESELLSDDEEDDTDNYELENFVDDFLSVEKDFTIY